MDEEKEDYNVKIYVDPHHRPYRACFTIGVQTFYVCEREDRAEAEWYVGCLKTAFENYTKSQLKEAFEVGGQYYTMRDHPSVKSEVQDFEEWIKLFFGRKIRMDKE